MSELREHYGNRLDFSSETIETIMSWAVTEERRFVEVEFVERLLDELLGMVDDRDRIIKILEDATSCLPCCVTDMMDDDDREFYNEFYNEGDEQMSEFQQRLVDLAEEKVSLDDATSILAECEEELDDTKEIVIILQKVLSRINPKIEQLIDDTDDFQFYVTHFGLLSDDD